MSQEHGRQRLEIPAPTPHERAVDRHEAAVEGLRITEKLLAEMVGAAEREVVEALAEVARYEQQPGIPLPVADQRHIEDLINVARQLGAERTGEDR